MLLSITQCLQILTNHRFFFRMSHGSNFENYLRKLIFKYCPALLVSMESLYSVRVSSNGLCKLRFLSFHKHQSRLVVTLKHSVAFVVIKKKHENIIGKIHETNTYHYLHHTVVAHMHRKVKFNILL